MTLSSSQLSSYPLSSSQVSAVVFDIGGVLLDWDPRHLYKKLIPDEAQREYFIANICNHEWNGALDRGRNWDEAVADLSARFPDHEHLIKAYRDRWIEMIKGPIDGSVAILHELKAKNIPLYCITNFNDVTLDMAAARYPFLNDFDGIIVSAKVKLLKPEAAIYEALLKAYNLKPENLYFTDDRAENVLAARAAGFESEIFTSPDQLRADLTARGLL